MIYQVNILKVKEHALEQFECAFREATGYLKSAHGYGGHSLSKSVETAGAYLLVIQWNSLEDHTERFRSADAHVHWKRLLDPFYQERPNSQHFHDALDGAAVLSQATAGAA